jgi:iron(III) transport system substrate-binding protein
MNGRAYKLVAGLLAVAVLALVGAGCGRDEPGSSGAATSASADECTNADVAAAIEGLGPEERTAKLKELAADEADTVQIYASLGDTELEAVLDAFTKEYGIDVDVLSAGSEDILQRLQQEAAADKVSVDLIENGGADQQLASAVGLLAPVSSPYAEDNPDWAVFPNWIAERVNVITVLRNPDLVEADDAPMTYEDLADPKWDGQLGVSAGFWDVMATVIAEMQKSGMSEEEAIGVWEDIVDGSMVYTEEGDVADQVNAGELGIGLTYNQYWTELHNGGSKTIEWEPTIEPQVLRPSGVGIPCQAPNPATATLMLDFFVSEEGQTLIGTPRDRDVPNPNVGTGLLPGSDLEQVIIDLPALVDEGSKWVDLYSNMTTAAGG